jgi:hypothetical protein
LVVNVRQKVDSALLIPGKMRAAHGRALELPTAEAKPETFGACPEKRLCATQLVLGTAIMGIAL